MSRLISNFNLVLSRPGLYAGGTSVEHVAHYVRGYLRGMEDFSSAPSPERELMEEFEGWLCRKLELPRQAWHKALAWKWREPERRSTTLREGFAEFLRETGREVTEYDFDRPEPSVRLADLARQKLLGLLRSIRKNPGAFLDRPAIDLLQAFHYGYDVGWADKNGVNAFGPAPYVLGDFAAWFGGHYNGASSAGFAYRIRERSGSDEEAFWLFWHYFDEYLVHRALDPAAGTVPWGFETFFRVSESISLECRLSVEQLGDTTLLRATAPEHAIGDWAEAFTTLRRGYDFKVSLLGETGEAVLSNQRDRSPSRAFDDGGGWHIVLNEWSVERLEEFFRRYLHGAEWLASSVAVLCPGHSTEWSERYRGTATVILFVTLGK